METIFTFRYFLSFCICLLLMLSHVVNGQENTDVISDYNEIKKNVEAMYTDAKKVDAIVKKNRRFIGVFSGKTPTTLPVGINKDIKGKDHTVLIRSMSFNATGATMDVLFIAENPADKKDTLGFKMIDAKFTPGSFNGATLSLISDYSTFFGKEEAKNEVVFFASNDDCSVTIDCKGFKSAKLKGYIEFHPDVLQYEKNTTPAPEPATASDAEEEKKELQLVNKVKLEFNAGMDDYFGDFIASVSMVEPKMVTHKKLDGFAIGVQSVYLDLSDAKNPETFKTPEGYLNSDAGTLWKGIYLSEASLYFPEEFNNKDESQGRVSISAPSIIIDKEGFTGRFIYKDQNALYANETNGGWKYDVKSADISILKNTIERLELQGSVTVPLIKDEDSNPAAFNYKTMLDASGNMLFNVEIKSELSYKLEYLAAKLNIFEGSRIEMKRENGTFKPSAYLNGSITITKESDKFNLPGIYFEGLEITSDADFDIKKFSLSGGKQIAVKDFPVSIKDLGFVKINPTNEYLNGRYGLEFNVKLNLAPSDETGITADAGFTLWGWKNNNSNIETKLVFEEIFVAADLNAVKFEGYLKLFDHHIKYGYGFKGAVKGWFKPELELGAVVQFGKVEDFRYWYVDAMVSSSKAIPLFADIGAYGFGGGAYYKMKRSGATIDLPKETETAKVLTGIVDKPEQSISGVVYEPDKSVKLGLKASMEIGTMSKRSTFNGNVSLEAVFRDAGSFAMYLDGNAYFMTEIDQRANSSIYATLAARIVHEPQKNESYFSFNAEAFMKVERNKKVLVKGGQINDNNIKAGRIEMFASKEKWFLYVGKPTIADRLSVSFPTAGLNANAYFDIGTEVPDIPPMSTLIAYKGLENSEIKNYRETTALNNGSGFAFGAGLQFHKVISKKSYKVDAKGGLGFDFMLKDYGGNAHCAGVTEPLGMNGWYATGQAYAYIQAGVWLKTKYFGSPKILDMGALATLYAQLPNPVYLNAHINAYYALFNGKLKGSFNKEIELGDQCNMETEDDAISDTILNTVYPANGAKDISLLSDITISFKYPVGKTFALDDGSGAQFVIDHSLVLKVNNAIVDGKGKLSDDFMAYTFSPNARLNHSDASNGNYKIELVLTPYKIVSGRKLPVIVGNAKVSERYEYTFTTTKDPLLKIPDENIDSLFPLKNMMNLYVDEAIPSSLILNKSQKDLLTIDTDKYEEILVRITDIADKKTMYNSCSINDKIISWDASATGLMSGKIYQFALVKHTAGSSELTNKLTWKEIEKDSDVELYQYHFRTSKYRTFDEKMKSFAYQSTLSPLYFEAPKDQLIGNLLQVEMSSGEFFDAYELSGVKPMIRAELLLEGSEWKSNFLNVIYGFDKSYFNRTTSSLPVCNFSIRNDDGSAQKLSDADIKTASASFTAKKCLLSSDADMTIHNEYDVLKAKAAATGNHAGFPVEYKNLPAGQYKLRFYYQIPGNIKIHTFDYNANFKTR